MIKKIKIQPGYEDQRLDKFLKRFFSNLNQSFIEKNIRKKNILINNKITKSNYNLKETDIIIIKNYTKASYSNFKPKKNRISTSKSILYNFEKSKLYEDNNFIVLDKWSGISTQGGTKIVESIDSIIKNISINFNLVHRLDKETSGLLIISKNLKFTKIFGNLFKSQAIKKIYIAICAGKPKIKESYVDLLIPYKKKEIGVVSKTYYKVLHYNNKFSLIQFEPHTGKKHQIRIVAKKLGCPIIGDKKYNLNNSNKNEKLKLNARNLYFKINDKKFNFSSKLPKDFINFLKLKNLKYLDL